MTPSVLLSSLLAVAAPSFAQAQAPGMLNLSCVEALVSIGQPHLAGVFSFVPEKDSSAAFADLLVHDKKALKKYIGKLEKDQKETGGVSAWDHDAVAFALTIYGSPMAETLDKPGKDVMAKLEGFAKAAKLTLQDMTVKRRKP